MGSFKVSYKDAPPNTYVGPLVQATALAMKQHRIVRREVKIVETYIAKYVNARKITLTPPQVKQLATLRRYLHNLDRQMQMMSAEAYPAELAYLIKLRQKLVRIKK